MRRDGEDDEKASVTGAPPEVTEAVGAIASVPSDPVAAAAAPPASDAATAARSVEESDPVAVCSALPAASAGTTAETVARTAPSERLRGGAGAFPTDVTPPPPESTTTAALVTPMEEDEAAAGVAVVTEVREPAARPVDTDAAGGRQRIPLPPAAEPYRTTSGEIAPSGAPRIHRTAEARAVERAEARKGETGNRRPAGSKASKGAERDGKYVCKNPDFQWFFDNIDRVKI